MLQILPLMKLVHSITTSFTGCSSDKSIEVVGLAPNSIGPYRGTISTLDMINGNWGGENQVIIGCDIVSNGISNLVQTAPGQPWYDSRYGNQPAIGNGDFCSQGIMASTVLTGALPGGPLSHVYLCPTNPNNGAAAMSLQSHRIHDGWRQWRWDNTPYDQFTLRMSQVLVHELIHVIDPLIIDYGQPGYNFNGITGLTAAQKITNAHSFSYAIVGLWLRHNTMGSMGQRLGRMSRKFSRNNRPAPGPHYDQAP
jgi:hypothetical protein